MRPIEDVLEELSRQDIKLWRDGDKLRYRAPKGALNSDLCAELSRRKEEIMLHVPKRESNPILIADQARRYEPFPLTEIQEAYWVGRSGAYDLGGVGVHGYLEIENNFDIDRLTQAWNKVIQRHEMLRAIVLPNGQQKILQHVPQYEIEVMDMRGKPESEVQSCLGQVCEELSHQVFASDKWPLFDIRATQLENDLTRLHISLDLLMADLWSLFIVFQDWADFTRDTGHKPEPLDVSFRDYVLHERDYRQTEAYQRDRKYWLERLDSLPMGPDLPKAKGLDGLHQPEFHRYAAELDTKTWRKLREQAQQHGLTPSGVLLAAYAEVLGRWSKHPRFNVNLTLFNRMPLHPHINRVVGDFTTTVLLEVDHRERESFASRARRLQQQMWHDLDHRSMNAVQVVREIARKRGGLSRAAMPVVFSSALGIDALDEGSPNLGQFGTQLGQVVKTISQTPQVWLDHQAVEHDGQLLFNWDGVEALFPTGMLSDMFDAYCTLLKQLAYSSETWAVSERALLPEAQLRQRRAVDSADDVSSDQLLHQLFYESCKSNGECSAIISKQRTMTYSELQTHVNRIGHRLRKLAVRPNTLVAVVMDKGWEQIAAVLGVMASGAAYVPIDPDLPEQRRTWLFGDAETKIVLTQTWVESRLSWPPDVMRLCVDDISTWADESTAVLESVQCADDLAYVIYTSGSTGVPKGVMIDHRGAVNTVLDINQRFGVNASDRVLALSALSFDLSVYDIFGLLAVGGAIVLPVSQSNKDAASWAELMTEHDVTIWNTVPALLQMMVEFISGRRDQCGDRLRLILSSGDWIPLNLPGKVASLWPEAQMISLGGATEASIWSICYPIESIDPAWSSIPYGRPLRNQMFHVFNAALEPCPIWVTGHLYISGTGLAKGYWRDAEKTRYRFVVHPQTGERLYKTGDLGHYLPDGNIEFMGREDFQVKLNGYRIELGEIEAALLQHSSVRETVVTTADGAGEAKQIIAYVVAARADGNTANPDGLKAPVQELSSLDKLKFKLEQRAIREPDPEHVSVQLKKPQFDDALTKRYLRHRAYRDYLDAPIAFEEFSGFLSGLLQLQIDGSPLPKYRYPSAGSLYPVQTYLYIKPGHIDGIQGGVYYYHPARHELMSLSESGEIDAKLQLAHQGPNLAIFERAAFAIFLIGELNAIEPLYGEWAKDFCYLEAGYIGQLLMDVAPDCEIGLCPIGKLDLNVLRPLFGWQDKQIFLQGFLGGGIAPEQIGQLDFVTPSKAVTSDDLRDFLQKKLPAHMVPAHYVFIDSLPLSANGKLDRKALTRMNNVKQKRSDSLTMPTTELQRQVLGIVKQELKTDQVGLNSNLFDLGADSVTVVRLNNRLVQEFQREIPVVEMFQYPTVNYLVSYLTQEKQSADETAQQRAEKIREARKRRSRVNSTALQK